MTRTSANILIGILGVMLLYGVAVLAGSSVKPVTAEIIVFTRTTIPRSQDVQVKDTTTTTLIHISYTTTTTVSVYPYQALCEFAASHGTAGQFIENVFVWGFDNTMGLERDDYYEETSQALFDIMDHTQLCHNKWGQFIIESSMPFMFEQQ